MVFSPRVRTYVTRALAAGGASTVAGAGFAFYFPHFEDNYWYKRDPGRVHQRVDIDVQGSKATGKTTGDQNATKKPKLVVLGSGWGSCSILKRIDRDMYDITVISPRNHFAYTPLLPSVCVGTISPDAVSVPIREFTSYKACGWWDRIKFMWRGHLPDRVDYIYAAATDIDPDNKLLTCKHHNRGTRTTSFTVPYDLLVVATGATTNTFNTKGVDEYSMFLKQTGDASLIRDKIIGNLELASLPGTTEEEKKNLLAVYVVGGGPTGVEVAAELQDFLMDDVVNPRHSIYRTCAGATSVTLVQSNAHLLPGYPSSVQECAERNLRDIGVKLLTDTRVTKISEDCITILDKPTEKAADLPYGLVVWATGVSPAHFAKSLMSKVPEQNSHRALRVDSRCQVLGTQGIFAIGDCAAVAFDNDYKRHLLQLYREIAKGTGSDGSYLSEQANASFIKGLESHFEKLFRTRAYKIHGKQIQEKIIADFEKLFNAAKEKSSGQEFKGLTEKDIEKVVENRLKRQTFHPPTAQVAHQQGEWMAEMLNQGILLRQGTDEHEFSFSVDHVAPFCFTNMGQLVYLGGHIAAMSIPSSEEVNVDWNGALTNTVWHAAYFGMLDSFSARCALAFDWIKGSIFGRPTSLNAICTPDTTGGIASLSRHATIDSLKGGDGTGVKKTPTTFWSN